MKSPWISKVIDFLCKRNPQIKLYKLDKKCPECLEVPQYFTQKVDGLYCGSCKELVKLDRKMHTASATINFDNLVAAFSGKTVEQCRAERERNNEVAELQHLGMLREVPKYITAKMRTGSEDLRPMKGIKALCIGDKPFWHNPDYEEGGVFYDRN